MVIIVMNINWEIGYILRNYYNNEFTHYSDNLEKYLLSLHINNVSLLLFHKEIMYLIEVCDLKGLKVKVTDLYNSLKNDIKHAYPEIYKYFMVLYENYNQLAYISCHSDVITEGKYSTRNDPKIKCLKFHDLDSIRLKVEIAQKLRNNKLEHEYIMVRSLDDIVRIKQDHVFRS